MKESANTFSTDLIILQAGINIKCNLTTQKITSRYIYVDLECPRSYSFFHPCPAACWLLSQHFYFHPSVRGSTPCRCLTLSRCVSLSGPPDVSGLRLFKDPGHCMWLDLQQFEFCVNFGVPQPLLDSCFGNPPTPPPSGCFLSADPLWFCSHCHLISLACVMDP